MILVDLHFLVRSELRYIIFRKSHSIYVIITGRDISRQTKIFHKEKKNTNEEIVRKIHASLHSLTLNMNA